MTCIPRSLASLRSVFRRMDPDGRRWLTRIVVGAPLFAAWAAALGWALDRAFGGNVASRPAATARRARRLERWTRRWAFVVSFAALLAYFGARSGSELDWREPIAMLPVDFMGALPLCDATGYWTDHAQQPLRGRWHEMGATRAASSALRAVFMAAGGNTYAGYIQTCARRRGGWEPGRPGCSARSRCCCAGRTPPS